MAKTDLQSEAEFKLAELRKEIESYIQQNRDFLEALKPIKIHESAPTIIREMAEAAERVNVGPMAAIAGAISERMCRYLAQFSDEVIVENGGDIYIINKEPLIVAIYAGNSPLSMKLGIELIPFPDGIGIATSSGTVGHSLSFGNADAVTVLSKNGSLADASATSICNMIKTKDDIQPALNFANKIPEILGILIIMDNMIGVSGEILKLKIISG